MFKVELLVDIATYIPLSYKMFTFSGGEIQIRLDEPPQIFTVPYEVWISAHIKNVSQIMELLLLSNALRKRYENISIVLFCPYLPYARQDRVCASGEAFSLHTMADLLNMQIYKAIYVWDVHNPEVTQQLIPNLVNITARKLLEDNALLTKIINKDTVIVAPDKGAVKRAGEVAYQFNLPLLIADKVRNPDNGEITGIAIDYNFQSKMDNCLIVDDICDGGRTFIELGKLLKPLTKNDVNLWVTHGIFSKGFKVFKGYIDNIFTANSFLENVPDNVYVLSIDE